MVSLTLRFLLLLILSSCSKLSYIYDQAHGQLKILNRAKDNNIVLNNPQVSTVAKEKIRDIINYKHFFYQFFQLPEKDIYSKTYLLDQKAVSYLVITSPLGKIQALEHCFPFVGCFPYLGFFDEQKAITFARQQQKQGLAVWKRDVYAYSTLGYFSDPILSSFFYYDRIQLAELVFHELFHTIFFVKGEVELNENLANFFAEKLVMIYFAKQPQLVTNFKHHKVVSNMISQRITNLTKELQKEYLVSSEKDSVILQHFLKNKFYPQLTALCEKFKKAKCTVLQGEWNNARLAAFLTYEAKQNSIGELFCKLHLDLKQFFDYIEHKYDSYDRQRGKFETYLLN